MTLTLSSQGGTPGHYSAAARAGDTLFISGQLPRDPATGEIFLGDVGTQAHHCLEQIRTILEQYDATIFDVAKVTVYVDDIGVWDVIDDVYASFFGDHRPARVVVPAGRLHHGVGIEIDAVAWLGR